MERPTKNYSDLYIGDNNPGDHLFIVRENETVRVKIKWHYSSISQTYSGPVFEFWDSDWNWISSNINWLSEVCDVKRELKEQGYILVALTELEITLYNPICFQHSS